MNITVRVTENVQLSVRKLAAAIPTVTDAEIRDGLEEATKEARGGWPGGGVGGYNVAPGPKGTYQRTGNLGASSNWRIEGKSYRFESNAYRQGQAYSVGVLGDGQSGAGQWGIHVGRWIPAFVTMQKWAKTMLQRIDQKLTAVIAEIR